MATKKTKIKTNKKTSNKKKVSARAKSAPRTAPKNAPKRTKIVVDRRARRAVASTTDARVKALEKMQDRWAPFIAQGLQAQKDIARAVNAVADLLGAKEGVTLDSVDELTGALLRYGQYRKNAAQAVAEDFGQGDPSFMVCWNDPAAPVQVGWGVYDAPTPHAAFELARKEHGLDNVTFFVRECAKGFNAFYDPEPVEAPDTSASAVDLEEKLRVAVEERDRFDADAGSYSMRLDEANEELRVLREREAQVQGNLDADGNPADVHDNGTHAMPQRFPDPSGVPAISDDEVVA